MVDHEAYTVGWICALAVEYVAARAFLDHRHPRPDALSANDNNQYTLGDIGGHLVVIAVLPDGEYGVSTAAAVARDMLHSFPNIRFGLMVGIGGGAPTPKQDIRLGDVVVSSSRGGNHGGLLSYDLGKERQGQQFLPTGFLNRAPPILRGAVTGLQAQYEEEGNQLDVKVRAILEGNVRMARKYACPAIHTDRLYEKNFVHCESQRSCNELCGDEQLVRRMKRVGDEDGPAVHYGLIASGSSLVRNALFRDEMATKKGILCFEMEAAGLANHFPCLVVRGICDYADSHKNKEWQGFAAMTAAAYAKDLLSHIVAQRVRAEQKATEILGAFEAQIDKLSEGIDNIQTIMDSSARDVEKATQAAELQKLPVAEGAEFGSYMDQHETECLPGTRTELLHDIAEWARSPAGKCIFWLYGLAGTGKSSVTLHREPLQERPTAGGELLLQARRRDAPGITTKTFEQQFSKLIYGPLSTLKPERKSILLIVIDALDECENDKDIRLILHLLPRVQAIGSLQLRIFVTSRPELPVQVGFRAIVLENKMQDLALHDVARPIIEHDIALFLRHNLAIIRETRLLPPEWPGNATFQILVDMSVPLFIFAATVCRLFEDHNLDPVQCLDDLLQYRNMESRLDGTYRPVLDRLLASYSGSRRQQLVGEFREIIGIIILLESPLSVESLSRLTSIPVRSISARLASLHSVLDIPPDDTMPIRLFHLSFRDFLVDTDTREKTPLWVDEGSTNTRITGYCIGVMERTLRKNICQLESYGTERKDISIHLIRESLPRELQYSCRYWTHHLVKSSPDLEHNLIDRVVAFLELHFLHWVEAMTLLGLISEVLEGINALMTAKSGFETDGLQEFLHDAKRFTLKNSRIAEVAPLQIYSSGLLFAPLKTIIRTKFVDNLAEYPSWISGLPQVAQTWGPELQTLGARPEALDRGIVIYRDGSRHFPPVAQTWGPELQTVGVGSESLVRCIAMSRDGRQLASCHSNRTVQTWNPTTGAPKHSFGTSNNLDQIALSPNGHLLASVASNDGSFGLWDPTTGTRLQTILDEASVVSAVSFSPDGSLGAGHADGKIKLWDTSSSVLKQTFNRHAAKIMSLGFSQDGTLLAATSEYVYGSLNPTVMVWDTAGGGLKCVFGRARTAYSVAFSPSGQLLAAAFTYENLVEIWDPRSGEKRYTIAVARPRALAFSPDGQLLTCSCGANIEILSTSAMKHQRSLCGHTSPVESILFGADGDLLVSCADEEIKLWNPTVDIEEGDDTASHGIRTLRFLCSADGQSLAVGRGMCIELYDSCDGSMKGRFEEDTSPYDLHISSTGRILLSASAHKIKVWDVNSKWLKYCIDHQFPRGRRALALSSTSKLIAYTCADHSIHVRYLDNMAPKGLLKSATSQDVSLLTFSPDDQLLAATSDNEIQLWDLTTGQPKQTFQTAGHAENAEFAIDPETGRPCLITNLGSFEIDLRYPYASRRDRMRQKHQGRGKGNVIASTSIDPEAWNLARLQSKSLLSLEGSQWVKIRGKKELWFPDEYRPRFAEIRGDMLALCCANERIMSIRFALN